MFTFQVGIFGRSTFSGRMPQEYHDNVKKSAEGAKKILLESAGGKAFGKLELMTAAKLISGPNAEGLLQKMKEAAEKNGGKVGGEVKHILESKFGQNAFRRQFMDPAKYATQELLSGTVIDAVEQVEFAKLVPLDDSATILNTVGKFLEPAAVKILKTKKAHANSPNRDSNGC